MSSVLTFISMRSTRKASDDSEVSGVPIRSGYLHKRGPATGSAERQRWFILEEDGDLKYFRTAGVASEGRSAKGIIPLITVTDVKATDDTNFVIMTSQRDFELRASCAADAHAWLSAIQSARDMLTTKEHATDQKEGKRPKDDAKSSPPGADAAEGLQRVGEPGQHNDEDEMSRRLLAAAQASLLSARAEARLKAAEKSRRLAKNRQAVEEESSLPRPVLKNLSSNDRQALSEWMETPTSIARWNGTEWKPGVSA